MLEFNNFGMVNVNFGMVSVNFCMVNLVNVGSRWSQSLKSLNSLRF